MASQPGALGGLPEQAGMIPAGWVPARLSERRNSGSVAPRPPRCPSRSASPRVIGTAIFSPALRARCGPSLCGHQQSRAVRVIGLQIADCERARAD